MSDFQIDKKVKLIRENGCCVYRMDSVKKFWFRVFGKVTHARVLKRIHTGHNCNRYIAEVQYINYTTQNNRK